MKETRVYIQDKYICSFYEEKLHIHAESNTPSQVCLLCSKIMIPRSTTMVLAHSIERCIDYLIPSNKYHQQLCGFDSWYWQRLNLYKGKKIIVQSVHK